MYLKANCCPTGFGMNVTHIIKYPPYKLVAKQFISALNSRVKLVVVGVITGLVIINSI